MVLLPILYNGVGYSPPPKKISPFPFPPRGPGPRPLHCYTSVHNPNGFSIKVQPMVFRVCLYFTIGRVCPPEKIFPLSSGDPAPTKHIVTLAHHSPQPERHLDRFSRFCRSHGCVDRPTDRQTDTHTNRPRYTDSNRPHLCSALRCIV